MMEDLSLHILDLAENSIVAGAGWIRIAVNENEARDLLTIRVSDNGHGMTADEQKRALDPFYTTKHKKTGLGLALMAQAAALTGGKLAVVSSPAEGTRVMASFPYHHIDRPPLTKMAATIMTLVFGHPEIDFRYRHRRNGQAFTFASRRFFHWTGAGPAWSSERIESVRKALREGLKRIGAS
ncbi:MAG: ATP-binding protein [Candidatus Aminicenantales bacterium]